jgi:hypothetical protein
MATPRLESLGAAVREADLDEMVFRRKIVTGLAAVNFGKYFFVTHKSPANPDSKSGRVALGPDFS